MKKRIAMILLIIILVFSNMTSTYAAGKWFKTEESNSDIWQTAKDWISYGKANKGDSGATTEWTSFNDLAGILWGAGVIIIIISGTILGIKYMFSSVEEKAGIKESMKPYIIGALIILGALTIWKFLVEILDKVS